MSKREGNKVYHNLRGAFPATIARDVFDPRPSISPSVTEVPVTRGHAGSPLRHATFL